MIAALHGHHNCLVSFFGTLDKRIKNIKTTKPLDQHALRLRLIRKIPLKELPTEVVAAGRIYLKAKKEFNESSWKAYGKTHKVYMKAEKAYIKTCAAHHDEFEAIHKRLCVPDCPWDGKTIFPEKK